MNLTQLLTQRRTLLRQGHLANLAFAYVRLSEFAQRLDRAGLKGTVRLRHAETETGTMRRWWRSTSRMRT